MKASEWHCAWCGKTYKSEKSKSNWEQDSHRSGWQILCNRCANSRLDNPYNAILPMRKRLDNNSQSGDEK